jgi:hypothetical protein
MGWGPNAMFWLENCWQPIATEFLVAPIASDGCCGRVLEAPDLRLPEIC